MDECEDRDSAQEVVKDPELWRFDVSTDVSLFFEEGRRLGQFQTSYFGFDMYVVQL